MAKYLRKFENHTEYEEARQNLVLPNVSLCAQENEVHYKPWVETKLVVYYDIQDISSPTTICTNLDSSIKSIEVDGVLLDSVVTTYQFDSVGEHVIKYEFNNPTTVGNSAPLFFNAPTIKRAIIADTFTSIGNSVFNGCTSLTSCTIGNGVTSIGSSAFYNCSGLTSIAIPSGVTSIGSNAFQKCTSLTSIDIPNSVTSIGSNAFEGCTSLPIENNIRYADTYVAGIADTTLTTYTIKEGTKWIGDRAFIGCKNLTSIIIPNSVTNIGGRAFNQCASLTSIDIPNSVTIISDNAFDNCSGLTSIEIGSGVTSIGNYAFWNCSSLSSIKVNSNNTVYDSRNNCNAIIKTSTNELIQGCKNTVIPNTITNISSSAFYGCTGLINMDIPNSVTSIGNSTFYGCSGLISVTIGSGVTSIGNQTFVGCSSLTSIASNRTIAPSIKFNTFLDVKTGGTLTVPSGSSGYDVWMGTGNYYLGKYNWTKVEQ